ncbi:ATP-binding protein [Sphingomonas crocodyli]|uniref:histidine kinase n=1 Tax=Sphingomonas crocodyli TaxID=1979270 RepID=A0A437M7S7_9SPHN|nr:ATP-binding protein [Sphingomonas crocodyli]RVT93637.1 hybrid sensor histidine kinase/response regulator [Sphingomonas crocodyli]
MAPAAFATVRARLVLLVAVLLVPAAIVAAALLWRSYHEEHRAAETQLTGMTRAMSIAVDRDIGQARVLVEALSASWWLKHGRWREFDAQAREVVAGTDRWVSVVTEDGRLLVNTHYPVGQLPVRNVKLAVSGTIGIGDRIVLHNLHFGVAPREPIVIVTRTIRTEDGQRLLLNVVRRASSFLELMQQQHIPPRWTGVVVDGNRTVIARSRANEAFVGKSVSPSMRERLAQSDEDVQPTVTLDGISSITAWKTSPTTRWTMIVAVPRDEMARGARGALIAGTILGIALLGLGLVGAVLVGRGIARPLERLSRAAGGLAEGGALPPPSGLAEIDAVQIALAGAAKLLRAREQELRDLNQDLEARVTERTRELAEATESLVQAQKMEAVGRLTGGIAHDFNNLLTAVIGNIELIEKGNADPKVARRLANARSAAERGARLTGQLLAFSRRQRLHTEAVDVNAVVTSASELLHSTLGSAIEIETALGADLPAVEADATQLDLILLNLAINARDAMPDGGRLRIVTAAQSVDDAPRGAEAPGPGDYVAIRVEDQGTGMSAETLSRVFEPFFTTKETGHGTGLGLPQVLGILKQMQGGIAIESTQGIGTVVTIYLPISGGVPVHAVPAPVTIGPDWSGVCVLLVDDDPDVRGVTAEMLREQGCEVVEAGSGREGLAQLESEPAIDFALLDFAMPGLNGAEAARLIRAQRPDLPILLMSGYADLEQLGALWSGPMLSKPFTAATLRARMDELRA